MKNILPKIFRVAIISMLVNCSSSNRLHEYEFRNSTTAALVSAPLPAEVVTDPDFFIDADNLLSSVLRLGSVLAKEIEADKIRVRLDSAVYLVDVPEKIRINTLNSCSKYLHFSPVDDYHNSDYLFDINIKKYGIDAQSWKSNIYFYIDLKIHLLDNKTGAEIWRSGIKVKEPVSKGIFGGGSYTVDNVITAVALSKLTVDEMTEIFHFLADYTAGRITKKLQRDFMKSREKRSVQ